MKEFALLFDALGHERRIHIITEMVNANTTELSFGELAGRTGISEAGLTHHLKMMRKGGLIRSRPRGRKTMLSLESSKTKRAMAELGLL